MGCWISERRRHWHRRCRRWRGVGSLSCGRCWLQARVEFALVESKTYRNLGDALNLLILVYHISVSWSKIDFLSKKSDKLQPVLKFVFEFKSGHRNSMQFSDLYQSCGMSLFSLCMSESDMYWYDNYGKVRYDHVCFQSGPCMIRPVPGLQIWFYMIIPGSNMIILDLTWSYLDKNDHTWLYMIIPGPDMIIPGPDMIIPDFTWSYLDQTWSYNL